MSLLFQQKTSAEIKQAAENNALILIPVGQIEEHGPHLPVDTDCIIAAAVTHKVAEEISNEIPVLVLPTIWNAYSVRQVSQWHGVITFQEPESMITMVYDVLASLVQNGFKKIVIINAHGNNPAILELACRKIGSHFNVFPAVTNVFSMSTAVGKKVRKSKMGGCGGHAGEEETALLLYLAPHLVHMDRATDVDLVQYRTRFFPGDIYSDIPDKVSGIHWSTWGVVKSITGAYGDPTPATAETGEAIFREMVKNHIDFLREYYSQTVSED